MWQTTFKAQLKKHTKFSFVLQIANLSERFKNTILNLLAAFTLGKYKLGFSFSSIALMKHVAIQYSGQNNNAESFVHETIGTNSRGQGEYEIG